MRKKKLQPALVCNYNRKKNWSISTMIGDKSTDSLRILYAGIFLSLHTDRCFDLVNSALGVNTDAKGTHSGCNPAFGHNHAVWISSIPPPQPEHWRSQWSSDKPPTPSQISSISPYYWCWMYYYFDSQERHKTYNCAKTAGFISLFEIQSISLNTGISNLDMKICEKIPIFDTIFKGKSKQLAWPDYE